MERVLKKVWLLVGWVIVTVAISGTIFAGVAACDLPAKNPEPGETAKAGSGPHEIEATYLGNIAGGALYKFCDGPNLIYTNNYNSIAVVGDALECKK
jgi:hypothetical protein